MFGKTKMTKQHKHITQKDFQRYLENQMTDKERFEFERFLQHNPFEAEALEGFEGYPASNLDGDIQSLSERLQHKTKQRNYRLWVGAASILLVVSLGFLFFWQVPDIIKKQVADVQVKEIIEPLTEEPLEVVNEFPAAEKEQVNSKTKQAQILEPMPHETAEMIQPKTILPKAEKVVLKEDKQLISDELAGLKSQKVAQNPPIRIRGISTLQRQKKNAFSAVSKDQTIKVVSGKVVSTEDNEPLPGVYIGLKGIAGGTVTDKEGQFKLALIGDTNKILVASLVGMETTEFELLSDSENTIKMDPSQLALDEVVAVGYASKRQKDVTGSISTVELKDGKAFPNGGFKEFKVYLEEKCVLPSGLKAKKTAVKLQFLINEIGEIDSIIGVNSPDSILFEKAKEIILLGPEWHPEIKNRQPVASKVMVRLKFKNE